MTTDTSSSELQSEPAVSSVTNGDQIALATSRAINLEDGHAFEMPARLFEQLPFAIYICDQDGFLLRYIAGLPSYGVARQKSAIAMNGSAVRIECFAPMALRCRMMNALWPMCCAREFPCAKEKFISKGPTVRAASR